MQLDQTFSVQQSRAQVWEFFDTETVRAALCIPGADEASKVKDDNYRIVISQRMGAVNATFDLKAEIKERKAPESMTVSVAGRSTKGARGDLRANAEVRLEENESGTRVHLSGKVYLGGMLGSMGHRVIAGRISELTQELAVKISEEIGLWIDE